ncbi:DUF3169 family protein [Paenibacillaceae bacterium]|nr:DUF3169 family protein [Paenibacillaceae bacterium]
MFFLWTRRRRQEMMLNKPKDAKDVDKRQKRKNVMSFIMFMLGGGVVGFIVSSGMIERLSEGMNVVPKIYFEYDVLFGILAIVSFVLIVWNIAGILRLVRVKGLHDVAGEDGPDPNNRLVGTLLQISNYNFIVTFASFVLAVAYTSGIETDLRPSAEQTFLLSVVLTGAVSLLAAIVLQYATIHQYNKYNPDRTLDMIAYRGERDLFDKMDEGEKWIVYRAAYRSFKTVNALMLIGILLFLFYSLVFSFSPLPIIVLAIIWILQKAAYYREVSKLGRL